MQMPPTTMTTQEQRRPRQPQEDGDDKDERSPVRMTKFEKTQLIGMRMEQIARGAHPTVDVDDGMSVRDVVIREIEEKTIPLMISRLMPNGKTETLRVSDFDEIF